MHRGTIIPQEVNKDTQHRLPECLYDEAAHLLKSKWPHTHSKGERERERDEKRRYQDGRYNLLEVKLANDIPSHLPYFIDHRKKVYIMWEGTAQREGYWEVEINEENI